MRNPEALDGAAFNIFSAFFDEEERQIAPFRFLKTMEDADCLAAMKRIVPTIHEQMDRIRDFVSGIPEEHKGCLIISSPYKKVYPGNTIHERKEVRCNIKRTCPGEEQRNQR